MDNTSTHIKPYSKNELATLYCISVRTLNRWLDKFVGDVGPYVGKCYTPAQVKLIFDKIGEP